MALLTLSELRALAAGADWFVHQDGCAWNPADAAERGCSCGATELRMALLSLIDVAIASRAAERLHIRYGELMAERCCGDPAIEDAADDLLPAVNQAADAAQEALDAALAALDRVAKSRSARQTTMPTDTPPPWCTDETLTAIAQHIVEALGMADADVCVDIRLAPRVTVDRDDVYGVVTPEDEGGSYTVYIDQTMPFHELVLTLAHELRHIYQYHVGWIPVDRRFVWKGEPYPRNRHYARRPEERDANQWAWTYWDTHREAIRAMAGVEAPHVQ